MGAAGYVFKVFGCCNMIMNSPVPVDAGAYVYVISYVIF